MLHLSEITPEPKCFFMLTIFDLTPTDFDLTSDYDYQNDLTERLDNLTSDFDQQIINEIVLWKVNRYAKLDPETLDAINKINTTATDIDVALTSEIFHKLLAKDQKGIRLAMATTILRFKNPRVYQILDPRVYRFIYGKNLNVSQTDINQQLEVYLEYLKKLQDISKLHNIAFEQADRILYKMDKLYNVDLNLNGY